MRCPTCASEINGSAVCPRCGTLTGLEAALQRNKSRLRNFFAEKRALLPKRFERHHFLWACALAPVFIVPPLFSLFSSIVLMRRGGEPSQETSLEWIAIVSALNIVVSGILLYRLGLYLSDIGAWLSGVLDLNLKHWFRDFFEPPPSTPKTTPV